MGYDKVRDKIFDLCYDHNEAFAVYKSSVREGLKSSLKMAKKKMDSAFKKIETLMKRIPPNYRYKNDLLEMYSTLKKDRADFEGIFK